MGTRQVLDRNALAATGNEDLQVRIWLNQAGITTGVTSLLGERIATAAKIATRVRGETPDPATIAREVFGVTPTTGQTQQVRGWLHALGLLDPGQRLSTAMNDVLTGAAKKLSHPGDRNANHQATRGLGELQVKDLVLGWLQARNLTPDTAETYFAIQADTVVTEALAFLDNQRDPTLDDLASALYGPGQTFQTLQPTQRAFITAVTHGAGLRPPTAGYTHTGTDLTTEFAAALTQARTLLALGQPLDIPALADRLFPRTNWPDRPPLHALLAGWFAGAGLLGPLPATGGRAALIARITAAAHHLTGQGHPVTPAALLTHALPALATVTPTPHQLDLITIWTETTPTPLTTTFHTTAPPIPATAAPAPAPAGVPSVAVPG